MKIRIKKNVRDKVLVSGDNVAERCRWESPEGETNVSRSIFELYKKWPLVFA